MAEMNENPKFVRMEEEDCGCCEFRHPCYQDFDGWHPLGPSYGRDCRDDDWRFTEADGEEPAEVVDQDGIRWISDATWNKRQASGFYESWDLKDLPKEERTS